MSSSNFNGKLIIFSAPSGAGKTTIVKHLLGMIKNLSFSISCTTREQRENEVDGTDYYFITIEEFKQKIQNNDFIEWEEVYPNGFYGTLQSEVERIWGENKHVIFDVDVEGGLNLKKRFENKALSIFVAPPSIETLKERLISRNTETEGSLKIRIHKATHEMKYATNFDSVIINNTLDEAIKDAESIIKEFIS